MGKFLESKRRENAFVEERLGGKVICKRCGATLATFADACTADLCDPCPGFEAIDSVKSEYYALPSGIKHSSR